MRRGVLAGDSTGIVKVDRMCAAEWERREEMTSVTTHLEKKKKKVGDTRRVDEVSLIYHQPSATYLHISVPSSASRHTGHRHRPAQKSFKCRRYLLAFQYKCKVSRFEQHRVKQTTSLGEVDVKAEETLGRKRSLGLAIAVVLENQKPGSLRNRYECGRLNASWFESSQAVFALLECMNYIKFMVATNLSIGSVVQ